MRSVNAKRFSRVMRDLARVPSQLSTAVAADISKEIQRGFDSSSDPYGTRWEKLSRYTIARRKYPGKPILSQTEAGRKSVVVAPQSGAGIRITVGVKYMIYHQFGNESTNLPQRSFLPTTVVPRTWGEIVLAHYEAAAKKVIERA